GEGQVKEGGGRIMWFDAANMPLIRGLDAHFFERGNRGANDFWQVDEGDERLWAEAGLAPDGTRAADAVHSPKYRYAGEATRRMLAAMPPGPDGARTLRYVNPATGGAVMPTLDCAALRLSAGTPAPKRGRAFKIIFPGVSRAGGSRLREDALALSQHPPVTPPHPSPASHP